MKILSALLTVVLTLSVVQATIAATTPQPRTEHPQPQRGDGR